MFHYDIAKIAVSGNKSEDGKNVLQIPARDQHNTEPDEVAAELTKQIGASAWAAEMDPPWICCKICR